MKTYYSLREQWEIVRPIWRIMLAVLIMQLIGAFVFIFVGKYGHPLIDLWFGGAASTFPGFIIGLVWHKIFSTEKSGNDLLAVSFVGGISLLLTIAAFVMPLEQFSLVIQKSF